MTEAQLRTVLLVSLGLNLFLGGYWLGGVLGRSLHQPGMEAGGLAAISERLRGKLSADGMLKIDRLVVDIESMLANGAPGVDSARTQLKAVVSADQFDRQGFLGIVDGLSTARGAADRAIADKIASVIAQMSPQDRRTLADTVLGTAAPRPPMLKQ